MRRLRFRRATLLLTRGMVVPRRKVVASGRHSGLDQALDALLICLGNERALAQIPLPLRRLLRQDVARVRLRTLHLATPGGLEALGRTLVRLHLRHDDLSFIAGSAPWVDP